MKSKIHKTIILFSIFFISFSLTSINAKHPDSDVYVCGDSKIYHTSRNHAALDRCKSGITKMSEAKAKSMGKRECKCKN